MELEASSSAIIQKSLPEKSEDLGSFTLLVTIGNLVVGKALLDLGASINRMPLSMLKKNWRRKSVADMDDIAVN